MSEIKVAEIPVLAIDGVSGVGKSSVSFRVAKELGWHYLNSGAIYRALAWDVINHNVSTDSVQDIAIRAEQLNLEFKPEIVGDTITILCNGHDITLFLSTPEITATSSLIAGYGEVRQKLLPLQRGFKQLPGLVAEGRDIGTVVFPDAPWKVFLFADAHTRAVRRYNQLKATQSCDKIPSLEEVERDIVIRDSNDSTRDVAPLKLADDCEVIDTSAKSLQQVADIITKMVKNERF